MTRLLFVDDEPRVLDGLRRALRAFTAKGDWEAEFVTDGEAALERLAVTPFDVIVTDMRMPGMDGATLLEHVRERYPHLVRLVLSGQSEREMAVRCLGHAHQYLDKPCDPVVLRDVVVRALALRDRLQGQTIRAVVAGMRTLPSMPTLYWELLGAIESGRPSVEQVGTIVARDPAMTAKVLHAVNSPFFGLRQSIANPVQAARFLGLDTLRILAVGAQLVSLFPGFAHSRFALDRLWRHSLGVAVLAKAIAESEQAPAAVADAAYAAGMLHDVGILILATCLPGPSGDVLARADDERHAVADVERQALGTTHAEIGAYLLGLWGLFDPVVEAVAYHHEPLQCLARTFSALTAVHVANALEQECLSSEEDGPTVGVDTEYLVQLGLVDRLPQWRELCRTRLPEVCER